MSKTVRKVNSRRTKKNTKKSVITLYEKVDFDILDKLISSDDVEIETKNKLIEYKNRRTGDYIPVNYNYSEFLIESGRLYAKEASLQNLKSEIRHAIAKDYYYDIDMENCGPRLILQYCKKRDIECEKLEVYVTDREKILEKVMRFHEVERNEAKKFLLKLCYLGGYKIVKHDKESNITEEFEPEKKIKFLLELSDEMKNIANSISKINKDTLKIVEEDDSKKNKNKKSRVMSIIVQEIEGKCLMSMYNYFIKNKCKVGALCFDGLMVEKNEMLEKNLKTMLRSCENFVKEETGYKIVLENKPMDKELSFELPAFTNFVTSDFEAYLKLIQIEGKDKFVYSEREIYIYDERTGMYSSDQTLLDYYLTKNRRYLDLLNKKGEVKGNYGEEDSLQCKIPRFVKSQSLDVEWVKRTSNSSVGYLLFADGIYNMKTGRFKKGFDSKIVFHARVPWKFPKYDKKLIKKARDVSFGRLLKEEDIRPMIVALAYALSGEAKHKKFYFCPGKRNAGKSILVNMFLNAFGNYIGTFNAENLQHKKNDSRDEAAKLRWTLLLRFQRIIFSNEINMSIEIDGGMLKKVSSGGDSIVGRTHGSEEISYRPHYTPFCMLNDIPKISPTDKAVQGRLNYIEFPYKFVEKEKLDKRDNYREKDDYINDIINSEEFISGFIHLILDGYKDYLENGLPEFNKDVKENWVADNKQKDVVIEKIKENFTITGEPTDIVTIPELRKFRENNKKIFATISSKRFNEILRKLGAVEGRNGKTRYWTNIKSEFNKEKLENVKK